MTWPHLSFPLLLPRPLLLPLPSPLCYSHSDLAAPQAGRAHSWLCAFGLACSSLWNALSPDSHTACSFISYRSLLTPFLLHGLSQALYLKYQPHHFLVPFLVLLFFALALTKYMLYFTYLICLLSTFLFTKMKVSRNQGLLFTSFVNCLSSYLLDWKFHQVRDFHLLVHWSTLRT